MCAEEVGMDFVHAAGLRLGFQRRGEGPCLLLLHGGVSDSRVWRRELDVLSDAFEVVAWDAPGCGSSSDPPEHFRMAQYADCLREFIDVLGLGCPHVLGHSWGSTLALELYRQHATMVSSLVLVGAYAGWAGSLPPEQVEQRLQFALQIATMLINQFEADSMQGLFSYVMPKDRAEELQTILSEIHPGGTKTMAYALAEADLREMLPRIEVPTLLVWGDADQRSPLSIARECHASIPRSTLTVMPGLGHDCYLESPETFEAEVRNFLLSLET